jgi:hypothetical protein
VVKSGGDQPLNEATAAWRSGQRVRLVASSRSGEWERERMGAQLGVWKRKTGGLAAGKTRDQ